MPILNFHLVESAYTQAQQEELLRRSSSFFAEVLGSPVERIRVFITLHRPELCAVGGELVSINEQLAPYFSFVVLEGRPVEERQRLLEGFTDIVVDVLDAKRDLVRGSVTPVHPENWSIGGRPASQIRQAEVQARAAAQ